MSSDNIQQQESPVIAQEQQAREVNCEMSTMHEKSLSEELQLNLDEVSMNIDNIALGIII